jgi:hypothetical protein
LSFTDRGKSALALGSDNSVEVWDDDEDDEDEE